LNEVKEEKARSEGVVSQLEERLKREFGCADLREAREKEKELEVELDGMEDDLIEIDKDLQEFEWK
jgi:hypothetical protein